MQDNDVIVVGSWGIHLPGLERGGDQEEHMKPIRLTAYAGAAARAASATGAFLGTGWPGCSDADDAGDGQDSL